MACHERLREDLTYRRHPNYAHARMAQFKMDFLLEAAPNYEDIRMSSVDELTVEFERFDEIRATNVMHNKQPIILVTVI
jgi:hypothetical protein